MSCMTNMAAGVLEQPLSHAEVLETASRVRDSYRDFMEEFIAQDVYKRQGGMSLKFGAVTLTEIATALILGIVVNLILSGKKAN